ncbi:unnamed protein product [Periconia digitata]|uniref:60S ribosomal protein L35a n=1 Tax=Periconia digitata TaxID=1303443 RepID=A0A9W4UCD9_9PLEO|nr:unnamed protein product [Periconia digitata]
MFGKEEANREHRIRYTQSGSGLALPHSSFQLSEYFEHHQVQLTSSKPHSVPDPIHAHLRAQEPFAMSEQSHRLYVKGKHISYQRGKRNTNPGTSLLKLEGVDSTEAAQWYAGKRVAYVYRAQRTVRGSKIRVIWGKVTRPHGNSGAVRAKFRSNLPPKTFGASVRVMLYPSSI